MFHTISKKILIITLILLLFSCTTTDQSPAEGSCIDLCWNQIEVGRTTLTDLEDILVDLEKEVQIAGFEKVSNGFFFIDTGMVETEIPARVILGQDQVVKQIHVSSIYDIDNVDQLVYKFGSPKYWTTTQYSEEENVASCLNWDEENYTDRGSWGILSYPEKGLSVKVRMNDGHPNLICPDSRIFEFSIYESQINVEKAIEKAHPSFSGLPSIEWKGYGGGY